MDPYEFTRRGRSQRAIVILGLYFLGLALLSVTVQAAWWIVLALAVPALPALWELYANPVSGLRLEQDRLTWKSGRRAGELGFDEIDHMRLDTRLDFSVRVSAVLLDGKRIRLPYECLPPHREFEVELVRRNLRVKRHHFTLF